MITNLKEWFLHLMFRKYVKSQISNTFVSKELTAVMYAEIEDQWRLQFPEDSGSTVSYELEEAFKFSKMIRITK